MNPSPTQTPAKPAKRLGNIARVTLAGVVVTLFAIAPSVSSAGDDADITVVFDADGMGFNATSSKDISNIVVVDCAGDDHKHDGLTGHSFVHREAFVIASVYVKSGDNANDEPGSPAGSGERFDNVGDCTPVTSTSTSTSPPTTPPPTATLPPVTTSPPTVTLPPATASPPTVTSPPITTAPPATTSDPPTPPPGTTTDGPTTDGNSTEVPFFTSGTALVLGFGGALAGTLAMLRRRL